MPFDGSGTFARLRSWINDAAAGIKIKSDFHDQNDDDIAAGLTNCITKDGQTQPTNHIPMNGKKLTNLGAPTADTDAANKAYVDALKAFSKGLEISGADVQGRLVFTSTTGVNGLSFTGADLGWFAKLADASATPPTTNRLVLNDKPDGSGTDVVEVRDTGAIISKGGLTSTTLIAKATTGNATLRILGPNNEDRMTIFTGTDTETSGYLRMKGSVNFEFNTSGQFKAPGAVYAGASYLNTDGNLSGSAWSAWGSTSAFNAISARIESRAAAFANDRIQSLQYRKVSLSYNNAASIQNLGGQVVVGYEREPGGNGQVFGLYFMYLQVYDPVRGWVGFSG